MPVPQPSQYQCDNMKPGDIIYVRDRNIFYKLYRKYFLDNKLTKIKVRKNWQDPVEYITYYQEDCTLMYEFEVKCVKSYKNEIPCAISYGNNKKPFKVVAINDLQIGLYNIQLCFKHLTLTLPIGSIDSGIKANQYTLKQLEDKRVIDEALRLEKYKGSYFKSVVVDKQIAEWIPSYCSICGKPVKFIFDEDIIKVYNECECNAMLINIDEMNYDEFAVWYTSQVNPVVKAHYNEFWFEKR